MEICRIVTWKSGDGESRIYAIIAVFILIVVIFAVMFSGRQFIPAYVGNDVLDGGWGENLAKRADDPQLFGLERLVSLTYEIDGSYPASLTVTTIKTLVMMNEQELRDRTAETIEQASERGIIIDPTTEATGEQLLNNTHKTMYIMYDGNDTSVTPVEHIKIIGETWNCGTSGTSIICIGVAQITDYAHNNETINTEQWDKIIGDDGLIFNVICH